MSKEKPPTIDPQVFSPEDLNRAMVDLEMRLHPVPWGDGRVEVCVLGRTIGPSDQRRYAQVTNLLLKTVGEGESLEPTFKLSHENAQALMDELYRIGFRPTEAAGPGELGATKAHLRDMRLLVSNALDIPELKTK